MSKTRRSKISKKFTKRQLTADDYIDKANQALADIQVRFNVYDIQYAYYFVAYCDNFFSYSQLQYYIPKHCHCEPMIVT